MGLLWPSFPPPPIGYTLRLRFQPAINAGLWQGPRAAMAEYIYWVNHHDVLPKSARQAQQPPRPRDAETAFVLELGQLLRPLAGYDWRGGALGSLAECWAEPAVFCRRHLGLFFSTFAAQAAGAPPPAGPAGFVRRLFGRRPSAFPHAARETSEAARLHCAAARLQSASAALCHFPTQAQMEPGTGLGVLCYDSYIPTAYV